jgi:hypothetical protein
MEIIAVFVVAAVVAIIGIGVGLRVGVGMDRRMSPPDAEQEREGHRDDGG